MAPSSVKDHLLALDAVRFVCAAIVLLFHFTTIFPLATTAATRMFDPAVMLPADAAAWTWWGWIGVEIFFVISGYVIALSARDAGRRAFLQRRLLRLIPAAWICATLTALTLLAYGIVPGGMIAKAWAASMLFWPFANQIDSVYWTLGVELVFYLLVAVCLKDDSDNRSRLERIGLSLALWSAGYWAVMLMTGGKPEFAKSTYAEHLLLLRYGAFFAFGIALQSMRQHGNRRLSLCTVAIAAPTMMVEIVAHARTMIGINGIHVEPAIPLLVFAAAMMVIRGAPQLQSKLTNTGMAGWFIAAGKSSYPLYLLHQVIGAAIIIALIGAGTQPIAAMVGAALTILILSTFVAIRAEPGARRILATLLRRINAPTRHALRPDIPQTASPPAG
ncbi:acyltransferase family protein [Sphingomonas sp.]|uniref:acyltransferase family protein n=1 Tax=Sphingomonas sp. TaxID=28214 RepID=UPI003D6CA5BC